MHYKHNFFNNEIFVFEYCKRKLCASSLFLEAQNKLNSEPPHKYDLDLSFLISSVKRYANYKANIPLIIGWYVVYVAHKWIDKTRAKRLKK